eukprot:3151694-Prymnesium_polylepis.1
MPIARVVKLFERAGVLGRMEVKQDVGVTPLPNESSVVFVADLPERVLRQAFVDARHALLAHGTPTVRTPKPPKLDLEYAHLQELLCRAAAKKYAALYQHMSLLERLSGIVNNLSGLEPPRETVSRAIR